jgi:hypothetical protein
MKCPSDNFSIIMNNFENPRSSSIAVAAASMYRVWYLQFHFLTVTQWIGSAGSKPMTLQC